MLLVGCVGSWGFGLCWFGGMGGWIGRGVGSGGWSTVGRGVKRFGGGRCRRTSICWTCSPARILGRSATSPSISSVRTGVTTRAAPSEVGRLLRRSPLHTRSGPGNAVTSAATDSQRTLSSYRTGSSTGTSHRPALSSSRRSTTKVSSYPISSVDQVRSSRLSKRRSTSPEPLVTRLPSTISFHGLSRNSPTTVGESSSHPPPARSPSRCQHTSTPSTPG